LLLLDPRLTLAAAFAAAFFMGVNCRSELAPTGVSIRFHLRNFQKVTT
jgi:hypothetical protein